MLYLVNFFSFIEEKYNFVKNLRAPECKRECLVTMKRNTCDNEDLHSLTNLHMYVKFNLIVEYDLLENDGKITFSEKIQL